MDLDDVTALFTRSDGSYLFARWGRPIAPVVFGVQDDTLNIVKDAFEAVAALSDQELAETDPELGSNCMMFFFREWGELLEVPDLDRLIDNLAPLVARLEAAEANQYRVFRFDEAGGIKAAFVFLRMDEHLGAVPADTLALSQVVQTVLLWSDAAFRERSPLAVIDGTTTILRPDIAGLIRAAYEPTMPVTTTDTTHALRLTARLQRQGVI